jgi:CheY-like chemotaxis protein
MSFVPSIRKYKGEWWIVEISLTGKTTHNAVYIARKLKEYFDGKEGAIFICNESEILVLAHMGMEEGEPAVLKGIHDKLPTHSCSVEAKDLTPDGVIKIQLQLQEFVERKGALPSVPLLLALRQERREHIIMVVDDDLFMRALIKKTFQPKVIVLEFKDTIGVVEAYLENVPDVVFLDIHLPGGSGIDTLAEIRGYDPTAYVFIISGDSVKDNILISKTLGASGFIAKPFTLEKLEVCYSNCPTVARHKAAKAV